MFFLGMTVTFLLRVNINLAIVGMVNTTSLELACEGTQYNMSENCLHSNVNASTNKQVIVILYNLRVTCCKLLHVSSDVSRVFTK
jgi:hypothetical protein